MRSAPKTTIALANPQRPHEVSLWCSVSAPRKDGSRRIHVINGEWEGRLTADGEVIVEVTKSRCPVLLVWEGTVPTHHARDYNDAINWIETQLQ